MAIGVLPKKISRGLGDKVFTMDTKIMGIRGVRGLRELRVVITEDMSEPSGLFRLSNSHPN
jgi:hypothetical protein